MSAAPALRMPQPLHFQIAGIPFSVLSEHPAHDRWLRTTYRRFAISEASGSISSSKRRVQFMLPFGNVRERKLREMWEHPPEQIHRLRDTQTYGQIRSCARCDLIDYCHRCHGLAQLETEAWDSCDTQARRTAEVVRAVVNYKKAGVVPDFPVDARGIEGNESGRVGAWRCDEGCASYSLGRRWEHVREEGK